MRYLIVLLLLLPTAGQRNVPGRYTCNVVSGCVAAYSAQRRMLSTYTGALFRLRRTGGGASSTDIGQTAAGRVDLAAVTTFCGTVSGTGTSTTTTNGCLVSKIYDHTANANDLTAQAHGTVKSYCDSPYAVNAAGQPIFINTISQTPDPDFGIPLSSICYYGNNAPTGTPTGNANVSIYIAANDILRTVEDPTATFGYGLDFGMLHSISVTNTDGSSFDLLVRGGPALGTGGGGPVNGADYLTFGVDLETTVAELAYGHSDKITAERTLSPNIASFSSIGDFVGAASYATSGSAIEIDFNNGQRIFTTTNTLDMGNGSTAQIREGHTGDDTGSCPGAWYEGAIYAATLTLGQKRALESNGQAFYQITPTPSCTNAPRNGGIDLLSGASVVTGAWGLRQLDPNLRGPVAIINRASDNTLMVLGTVKGTCDVDTAAAATFLTATTGHIYTLFNQVIYGSQNVAWPNPLYDGSRLTSGGSFTTGPTYTDSGLGGHPVMTFASSSLLNSDAFRSMTRPWSLLAAVSRTNASGGAFFTSTSGTNFLGASTANTLKVQSGSGTFEITNADTTWHAVAGTVPTNTSLVACSNGSCSTSGAVTTADQTNITWTLGTGTFTGAMTELYLVNGVAVSSTQIAALSAAQRAYYGF